MIGDSGNGFLIRGRYGMRILWVDGYSWCIEFLSSDKRKICRFD